MTVAVTRMAAGVAAVLALTAISTVSGCAVVDSITRTAYCPPQDPVVTPERAAPGDEVHVEVAGRDDGAKCKSRMPARARYLVSIMSEKMAADPDEGRYSESLGRLDPSSDGDAEGTFRVPDDAPVGKAEISLNLQGADTICDIDPSIGCAKDPWAAIEVTG